MQKYIILGGKRKAFRRVKQKKNEEYS
jgi:hypothetical protein